MSDDVDYANDRADRERELAIAAARSRPTVAPSKWCANECGEPSLAGGRFCSPECARDFEHILTMRRINGLPDN